MELGYVFILSSGERYTELIFGKTFSLIDLVHEYLGYFLFHLLNNLKRKQQNHVTTFEMSIHMNEMVGWKMRVRMGTRHMSIRFVQKMGEELGIFINVV